MKKLLLILLISFSARFLISFIVWHPDVRNHMDWGIRFFEYGPAKFFEPESNVWNFTWPNQPPGTIYMFAGIRKLFEFVFGFFWWINVKIPSFPSAIITYFENNLYPALLKVPAILADLGVAVLIYKFILNLKSKTINHQKAALFGAVIWLFNPAVWYNSTIWGQYDSVINFLALLAFYLLLRRKLVVSVLFLALSLYTKASLLIFIPIFAIVAMRQKYKLSTYFIAGGLSLLTVGLLTLPFSRGEPLGWLFNLYQNKVFVQQLHVITANAFNFWAGLTGIYEQPESLPLLGLTHHLWGLILFGLSYIPALYLVYKKQDIKSIMWALAISAFSSFMLLTNMHERYLYPLFAPFTILAVLEARLLPLYWAVSGVSVINLWHLWWTPKVQELIDLMSFGDRLMPRILGFINFGLFLVIYRRFLRLLGSPRLQ